ncbi:hypothetical protein Agabi119p4_7310 [Agaricus bisporus var. burnettii]|uniref:Thioesterase domain-containing protein n=1 Tax=Agaricus bisporus var. burnettii TaxID=192524 RepID=A0A8H7EZ53_AGABI|nr:hypothetical protein Agabi119p4_7310 [Agaricus bisporus var. burnettii]
MAPYSKALNVHCVSRAEKESAIYHGTVDSEWLVVRVPHGGYVLGLMVEAVINFQSETPHKDPIHVTAHFLRQSAPEPFEIHIRVLKSGKIFTNIIAELIQKNTLKVTTHMIFSHNAPAAGNTSNLTLQPPSPYARRIPLHFHPSEAVTKAIPTNRYQFRNHVEAASDKEYAARNAPDSPNRSNSSTIGGDGLEWGTWFGFSDKEERITYSSIPFWADMFSNLPTMLPPNEKKGMGLSWFPTVTLSIEFKAPIPPPSEFHASRTVGIYSNGKFMGHPQGRHEAYVEVWSAPTNIGEDKLIEGWRDKQICLATATQMALVIPLEEAIKKADREQARL